MFITLEGIEGSGKSTQILHVFNFLNESGLKCVMTREPGGTRIGRKIRSILLDPESAAMNPAAELLLYTADRVQHIQEIILPMIAGGSIVICDRYFDATLAYQGIARGLDMALILDLHKLICRNLKPDLTFLLDLSPDAGLQRAWNQLKSGSRMDTESRFENEALAFHERVRTGYLGIAEKEPERFRIIDASQSEDQVRAQITRVLKFEIQKFMDPSAQDDIKCT
ncbi:MAG: dTMP kinase [Deltaproteobacteria bacterium]|nr:dTMP kinase [Deltaproteobacteria bacterium]